MIDDGDPAPDQVVPHPANDDSELPEPVASPPVAMQPSMQNAEKLRILEALLFAAAEPLDEKTLAAPFDEEEDIAPLLQQLEENYASRGVHLTCVGGRWAFRTAEDLGYLLEKHTVTQRRLSRAALETLSIIAYHQPTTRAEIEEIRGVATSKGTLDVLLETGWIKMRGRRRAPGRPVTYGTSHAFLEHFGFESLADLPGLSELKGAGLLSSSVPAGFVMPIPTDLPELTEDEDRLDDPHPDDLDDGPGLFDDDPDERGDDNDLDLDTPDAER